MLKKLKLTIAAIFISGYLFAIPNITIYGCAYGSVNHQAGTVTLTCVGNSGECVVISSGVAPNGAQAWRVSINWACSGGSWKDYWFIEYPVIYEVEEGTKISGNFIPGM